MLLTEPKFVFVIKVMNVKFYSKDYSNKKMLIVIQFPNSKNQLFLFPIVSLISEFSEHRF